MAGHGFGGEELRMQESMAAFSEAEARKARPVVAGHERQISHDEAKEIASRLIAGAFGRDDNRPRFSIPCRPWDDDDCLIIEYIKQQSERI